METLNLLKVPVSVDLATIDRERRAQFWNRAASEISAGISVNSMDSSHAIGSIQQLRLGSGALAAIRSAPVEISYRPRQVGRFDQFVTMILEVDGSTHVSQGLRRCELNPSDICFVDESQPFRLVSAECSQMLLVRMPRSIVLSRFPEVGQLIATAVPGADAGTQLLSSTVRNLFQVARDLRDSQQAAALDAIIVLIGASASLSNDADNTHWRVLKALKFIELNLSVPGLCAEQVAQDQRISRRRLDELFIEACGESIASQIRRRRLQRAAEDLRDPRLLGRSISQIAFASGFEDAAHFARAFKRCYEVTPREWRLVAPSAAH